MALKILGKLKSGVDEIAEQARTVLKKKNLYKKAGAGVQELAEQARATLNKVKVIDAKAKAKVARLPGGSQTTLGQLPAALGETVKEAAQGTARSVASAGLTVMGAAGGEREQAIPEEGGGVAGAVGRTVFGEPGKPLKSIETRIAEGEVSIKDFAQAVKNGDIQLPFLNQKQSTAAATKLEKSALPISVIGIGGMIFADFTPMGGRTKLIKELASIDNVADVISTLQKTKMPQEVIDAVAGKIADTKSIPEIDSVLKIAKKNFDTEGKKGLEAGIRQEKERGFITSAKEVLPKAERIAGQYIPRSTDELSVMAKNYIKDDPEAAERLATTGDDEVAVALSSELLKKYGADAAAAEAKGDIVVANALYDKAADVANAIAPKLTDAGRTVQAATILGRLTPEGQVRFAARQIQKYNENAFRKVPELTGEQTKEIVTKMKEIAELPDGTEKAMQFQELQDFMGELIPTPLWKKVTTVWKAGLLTGVKTSGLNILANVSHAGSEVIKDVPAAIVDSMASLFTGERTKTFTVRGSAKGLGEGVDKGWRYLKTGFDERNIGEKLDYKKVNFGHGPIAKVFQGYTGAVFRVIGAEDQPFYYGAVARSLYDQALAKGINNGLSGKSLREFANNQVKNPDAEMTKTAAVDAATAVFQNETWLGKAAQAWQKIPVVGEATVPFARTPSAVAMQIINYTPVGMAKEVFSQIARGQFDQRAFSQAVGRGLTGTAVLAMGYILGQKGMVALDRPTDERTQKLWEAEGRKPNTIKIGDKWRSPIILGPAGNLLLVGAHFQNAFKESGSPTAAITKASLGSAKSFMEQTFLKGINSLSQALSDPERFGESYLANLAGSVVPTIVADVARATDSLERRSVGMMERVQSRVPGWRDKLEPQVDVLGRPIESAGNPLEILIDPTRPSPDISTATTAELRRLTEEGFSISPTLLGDKEGYPALSKEENTEMWELAGGVVNDKLTTLFSLPEYKELTDEEKSEVVEKVIDKSKTNARAAMVIKLTSGSPETQLVEKLLELKEGGLLTKEVFRVYDDLR